MKYRRKPEIVEAVQWWKHGDSPLVEFPQFKQPPSPDEIHYQCKFRFLDHGMIFNGTIFCPGLWVVDSNDGVKIMSDDEFNDEFEPVEE